MPEFVVEGLTAAYDAEPVVRDVSFRLPAGSMLAVTGASGAGKSTLLWCLAGAKRPVGGTITVDAAAVTDHRSGRRAGVALMPQGNGLALGLTALENVVLPLVAQGMSGPEANERARTRLEQVGLGDSSTHLIEELSGGQQQRVAVARLLADTGEVLLADEPTSDLDAANRATVMTLLRERAQAGAVVVVTTHDQEAAEVADGEIHLDEGTPSTVRELMPGSAPVPSHPSQPASAPPSRLLDEPDLTDWGV